jgi:hypothetical protein
VRAHGNTPANTFKACVIGGPNPSGCTPGPTVPTTPLHRRYLTWTAPNVGTVATWSVYRLLGATVTPQSTKVLLTSTLAGSATSYIDTEELPHGVKYTYLIVPHFTDGAIGGPSNYSTITAENDAPVAVPDSYSVAKANLQLVVPARGVLANDTDTDSPLPSLTAVLVAPPPNASQFQLNSDGSFTYTAKNGFKGTDTFTYKAKDVTPLSNRNILTTVTIQVK